MKTVKFDSQFTSQPFWEQRVDWIHLQRKGVELAELGNGDMYTFDSNGLGVRWFEESEIKEYFNKVVESLKKFGYSEEVFIESTRKDFLLESLRYQKENNNFNRDMDSIVVQLLRQLGEEVSTDVKDATQ